MNHDPREQALLTVDEQAIASNTEFLSGVAGKPLMAVIKADGFGHGLLTVAKTALGHGADSLGSTGLADPLRLRAAGVQAPILSWLNPVSANFEEAISHRIMLAVPSVEHLDAILRAATALGQSAVVHLQLDLGMHREGLDPEAFEDLLSRLCRDPRADQLRVVGLMGHLGWAEDSSDALNVRAREVFEQAWRQCEEAGLGIRFRHLGGTAAVLADSRNHYDFCRVGAGLVGIDPSGSHRLRPAITLTAPVLETRRVRAGEYIGYGRHHRTAKASNLALLPLGYADGIPRISSGLGQVRLAGKNRAITGLVNMDQIVVDTGEDRVLPGEVATIFGAGTDGEPTVADWATWCNTLPHEIITGIGPRVHRINRPTAVVR
ncbi:alanine racemase [Psychromicrobium lacuslunae]|uniref:Alanine racemase n=1 Tax=Psychromicrobium lacuslunae TaxID=1618207 RepID=A0A0D4C0M2_9MICC|nr:alanine racemase [Psychromicrobium lacuslunae]AJT42089.1 hypothetical protein UM93_12285 [Psychromicrobium lacuslunae]